MAKTKAKRTKTQKTADPLDADAMARALRQEAEDRRQECGRIIQATLAKHGCELVAVPTFVDIADGKHAVQCAFDVRAKIKGAG